jgi:hypothetical protein
MVSASRLQLGRTAVGLPSESHLVAVEARTAACWILTERYTWFDSGMAVSSI